MPPELRKRKAPAAESAAAPAPKKKGQVAKAVAKIKEVVTGKADKASASPSASKVAVGDTINLEGFGGIISLNDGVETTLKKLVEESSAGVVLFTYPRASTPGCKCFLTSFDDLNRDLMLIISIRYHSSMQLQRFIR